ncbi:hypothetical protein [Streptomyces sp. enrichment culture]
MSGLDRSSRIGNQVVRRRVVPILRPPVDGPDAHRAGTVERSP